MSNGFFQLNSAASLFQAWHCFGFQSEWGCVIFFGLKPYLQHLLHSLFSNTSTPTFCHRTVHWGFAQGEDVHKDKPNTEFLCACDSHPHHSKGWEQHPQLWLERDLMSRSVSVMQMDPPPSRLDCISWLCSLAEKTAIWKLPWFLSQSHLLLDSLFLAIYTH